jgi:hypothetical protein
MNSMIPFFLILSFELITVINAQTWIFQNMIQMEEL